MRPSSSRSDQDPGGAAGIGLFDGVLSAGPVHEAVSDAAWLRAMLDAEAALARAQARIGLIPPEAAEAITNACHASRFDPAALARDAVSSGNPVVPLVRALRAQLPPDVARFAHAGATSQDIIDSAAMLIAHRATGPLRADLASAADRAATLAAAHRDTPVAGRTLLQQALPTTFGLVAAGWMTALDAAGARLARVRHGALAAQLGGAAGTLAAIDDLATHRPGPAGPELIGVFAGELGLNEPILPWHTDRGRIAELAGVLAHAAGTAAKIARDVILMAQTEVGEVREGGGRGGSSAMPHKANPIAAISAAASAARAPGLAATLYAAMPHEHQRAAGPWHAEWLPLTDLLRATGSAAHWLRDCLGTLEIDTARMRTNLDLTGGALLAERVAGALAGTIGKDAAHDLVADVTRAGHPLAGDPRITAHLDHATVTALLDPAGYLGSAGALVDRALSAHPKGDA
ncbi:3-carboxy-cis,cis-muconate cycloisomerase [Catenuloplanes nepalensis]|uniref:3-carboxy-cis,cis-muconate cycloisomerase n=1 Tax=Catenuloplanes nepalensis TaxID=587533 RepID=A0ABT9MZ27_9ACTN|nr:3-carboxy-cis,cis-muconate cycloisomerase [Catenuloplanes nepalensis]MDP9796694.1 3-carboxy-cis,cis-muconate cycloisomerase [Catenuloplanes nepalensis]